LVLLRRSAGLLPLRDTVQHRLADGSGELRGAARRRAAVASRLGSKPESQTPPGCSSELDRVAESLGEIRFTTWNFRAGDHKMAGPQWNR